MKKSFLLIALAICSISMMAQDVYNDPVVEYKDGSCLQTYETDNMIVMVSGQVMKYTAYNPKEFILTFAIVSKGVKIDANPQKVTVASIQKNGKETPVTPYQYADYEKRTKKNFILFGAEMPNQTATQKTTIEVKDQYGITQGTVTGQTQTTVNDPSVAPLGEQGEDFVKKHLTRYFRRTTVIPDSPVVGDLACPYTKKDVKYSVSIVLNGSTYNFVFDLTE